MTRRDPLRRLEDYVRTEPAIEVQADLREAISSIRSLVEAARLFVLDEGMTDATNHSSKGLPQSE